MTTIDGRSMNFVEFTVFRAVTLWTATATAIHHLAHPASPTRRVYASPVSLEWLESNAIESAKHGDDL